MTTTTKRGFFTALMAAAAAAIARAQTTIITPCRPKIQWGGQIPLCNGQCPNPECAYRAPEFESFVNTDIHEKPEFNFSEFSTHGLPIWSGSLNAEGKLPILARINRCPNCNTAFWQDPQEEKG